MATQAELAREKIRDLTNEINALEAKYGEDNLPSAEEVSTLEAMYNARADVRETLANLAKVTALRQANGGRDPDESAGPPRAAGGGLSIVERPSIASRYFDSKAFKGYHEQLAGPDGIIGNLDNTHVTTPKFHFGGLKEMRQQAALLTGVSDTSGGALVVNDRYPLVTEYGRRPLTIVDLITVLTTNSDAVDFARITAETINAAAVAEATASAGSSGVKPESELAVEKVTTLVRTIAHWMAATKRVMSDLPQLRGLIDSFLEYGLDLTLENEIVTGAGTGEHFTGIEVTSGIQTQAWTTDILTTTRQMRRKVLTVGRRRPNGYILNPIDWEGIDLLQDNEARYYFGGPMVMGTPRLWGLPVVESEAVTQGFGLCGDFSVCVLWDREDASISMTDSHADFFIRNLIAILAELRAAFGILKPNAIIRGDLTA